MPRDTTLIQVRVPIKVKEAADEAFAKNGISTPMALRVLVAQVARTGETPFDDLWLGEDGRAFARLAASRFSDED